MLQVYILHLEFTSQPYNPVLINQPLLSFVALSLASIKTCIPDLPLDSCKRDAVRTFYRLASCILTQKQNILTGCSTVLHNPIHPSTTWVHVMSADTLCTGTHMGRHPHMVKYASLWGDSTEKQESRQVKWSHTLVSTAVTLNLHVLEATLPEEQPTTSNDIERISSYRCTQD